MNSQTISQQLEQASGGRLKAVTEHGKQLWTMFNDGGVECEVGEFLYALTRMIKPWRILETGTHLGVSAAYMGQALADNFKESSLAEGKIETLEYQPENYHQANALISQLGLQDFVKLTQGDAREFNPPGYEYDLIFLDTEPQTRFQELIKFFPVLKPGGIVLIHDLHNHMHQIANEEHGFAWPYGRLPEPIKELVKSNQLRPVHFRTPRGLTLFYKVHPTDYVF